MVRKQQIQVDVEGAAETGGAEAGASGLPSLARVERQLVLPTQGALQDALEAATGSEELASLRQVAAAYQDLGERLKLAKDELVRVAIWRIDVERKLGEELARTVGRGGSGSNLHAASSKRGGSSRGLPKEVNWSASKRYQDLAAIPQDVLQDYFARTAKRGGVPSPGGARSFALRQGRAPSPRPRKATKKVRAGEANGSGALSPAVLEAVERFLGSIDVLVGAAPVRSKLQVDPQVVSQGKLKGSVFVAECPDPASWMPKLAALRMSGSVAQVLVALPAHAAAASFHEVSSDWVMCFLLSDNMTAPAVVAYHGSRLAPFRLVFGEMGVLVRGFAGEAVGAV